jgi:uncharacterized damage-inducible protein DinB
MNRIEQLQLMAAYNAWMNTKVYEAASRLTPVELRCERGAFFGSILGTLNHLVVGDRSGSSALLDIQPDLRR